MNSASAAGAQSKPLQMSVGFFAAMFPTHVCFNRQMVIEHCGEFLFNELDMAKKRTSKVTDLFTLIQPDDVPLNFKSIVTYLNSVFILRLKIPIRRNTAAGHNGNHNGKGGQRGGAGGSAHLQRGVFEGLDALKPTTASLEQYPSYLAFKGQMVLVNNGNSLLYMCSPHVTTVRGLMEANLYISDLQRHDTTRDLIMLTQSRISQQELK
jgi:guanylate cyclase soluble subunit beta